VTGGSGSVSVTTGVFNPVVAGEYPVSVSYGGQETAIGTAVIESRSTDGVSVLTAPSAADIEDESDVDSVATGDATVALDRLTLDHDWLVLRVEASGLGGYVHQASDLHGANGLSVTVEESESTVEANAGPATLDAGEMTLLSNPDEDTYYLLTRPQVPRNGDIETGDRFEVTFTVDGDRNAVTYSTQEVTTSFTFVGGTVNFDTEGGAMSVAQSGESTVTGTSTFAAGTDVEVRLRSVGGESPFTTSSTATIQSDGSWSATFDLADRPDGQTFTARVSKADKGRSKAEGEVRAGDGAATESDEDTPTASDGDDDTPSEAGRTPTSTPAPGFGLVAALAALAAVALLTRRD
jgi:PGF-CTERM protein